MPHTASIISRALFCAGVDAGIRTLRILHGTEFLPLVSLLGTEPDSRLFLIKLWGGTRRGPAATQFFIYTMAGSAALLVAFLAVFLATGSMDFPHLTLLASTGELEQLVTAHLGQ